MKLSELRNHTDTIRAELDKVPCHFIRDEPRTEGEWNASQYMKDVVTLYENGKSGWLAGGQDHVQKEWISWPLVWNGYPVKGNADLCPETMKLLTSLDEGVGVAGFSLMKGGVKLNEHVDPVSSNYIITYHLGLKCPSNCYVHHSVTGTDTHKYGKHLILDARQIHSAENQSDEDRVILYLEIYS